MFNLRLCNAATIRYFILKFGHLHLCGKGYNYFSPHCCKCNSLGGIAAIRCGNACHGPHSDSVYSGSEHRQFNSPRLVKREAGFPSPRRALIGSYQLWRVNDSPYYRELQRTSSSTQLLQHGVTKWTILQFIKDLLDHSEGMLIGMNSSWDDSLIHSAGILGGVNHPEFVHRGLTHPLRRCSSWVGSQRTISSIQQVC